MLVIVYEAGAKDIRDQNIVDSLVRSPAGSERTRSSSYYDALVAPGFDLFPKWSDDWVRYEKTPDSPSHVSTISLLPAADILVLISQLQQVVCLFLSLFLCCIHFVIFMLRHT
jgi:hypothetical protein